MLLIGYAFLIARFLGVAVIFSALLGALIFHLGWRQEHPNVFWPIRPLLGFGGVIVIGSGLFMGSVAVIGLGVLTYCVSLFLGPSTREPVI